MIYRMIYDEWRFMVSRRNETTTFLFSLEVILEKDTDNRAGKDKNQSILQDEIIFPSCYNLPGDNNSNRNDASLGDDKNTILKINMQPKISVWFTFRVYVVILKYQFLSL